MEQYLLFAIVGLGFGCIYAALGMGVVITYRGTGVINFATGAMAMWGAYVYDELATHRLPEVSGRGDSPQGQDRRRRAVRAIAHPRDPLVQPASGLWCTSWSSVH